jgi:hypothetical protein
MGKLRVAREYEVTMPVQGSDEWYKLVQTMRDNGDWEDYTAEVNKENVASVLTNQADVGNEDYYGLASASVVNETYFDPEHYFIVLEAA